MSSTKIRKLDLAVGIFGLLSIGVVVGLLYFYGKLDLDTNNHYPVTAEVHDASGLRKGVPVRLGGMPVGTVASEPRLKDDYSGMLVSLHIYQTIKIPKGSKFAITTVGLMGDSYVKISLPEKLSGEFLAEQSVVPCTNTSLLELMEDVDVNGLVGEISTTFTEANSAIEELREVFTSIETLTTSIETLTSDENFELFETTLKSLSESSQSINKATDSLPTTLDSLSATMDNFKKVSSDLEKTAQRLDPLLASAESTIGKIDSTTKSADKLFQSADELFQEIDTDTFNTLEETLAQVDKTLVSVNTLVYQMENGNGLAKDLIKNPTLRSDVINLLDKVERKGFLFYPREKKKQ